MSLSTMCQEKNDFSSWIEQFRDYLVMKNHSPLTIRGYIPVIENFSRYLEDMGAAPGRCGFDVSSNVVSDFFLVLSSSRKLKASTMNRKISAVVSFYRFLCLRGAVSFNPVSGIERPKIKGKDIRYLKHDQVMNLIGSIDNERDRLLFRLIYATGIRLSEMCGIDISDIDFEGQIIRVTGKGGKIRTVFVDPDTIADIKRFLWSRESGPLFLGHQGTALSPRAVEHVFRRYAPAGITPHTIRHSYATELYRRSKNLLVVQENLGHASIKTTEIYLHADLDERRRVYKEYFPLSRSTPQECS